MNEKNVKMKEIKYTILSCVCEITVGTVINYCSGSATAKSHVSYGSGCATLGSGDSDPSQKVLNTETKKTHL
jgi:hypothetical protein